VKTRISFQRSLFLLAIVGVTQLSLVANSDAEEFTVLTHNVDNFFDVDGVAVYDDYKYGRYGAGHLSKKLSNLTELLQQLPSAPEILVLNELEIDQTPSHKPHELEKWLASVNGQRYEDLLKDPSMHDVPVEFWLAKALVDDGIGTYFVGASNERPGQYNDGRRLAVKNVILSKFPIEELKTHPAGGARAIVEARINVAGQPLTVFANHWKSGASDPKTEQIRIGNARVLRQRIDGILKGNPQAAIIIAGDLNSHYNQHLRYPHLQQVAIRDILHSSGDERSVKSGQKDLYNLWFEVPPARRGSDIFRGQWGTLMHILITPGLMDSKGIDYVDNSFEVIAKQGFNVDEFGRPVRWNNKVGDGVSDHLPLIAKFRLAESNEGGSVGFDSGTESSISRKGRSAKPSIEEVRASGPPVAAEIPNLIENGRFGSVYLVEGPAWIDKGGNIMVEVSGQDFQIYAHQKSLRRKLRDLVKKDGRLRVFGEFGNFRGRWQFVIQDASWINPEEEPAGFWDWLKNFLSK